MLVLAGIELIFFIIARMGLCFGFVLKTVLMFSGTFLLLLSSAYTESRPSLLLTAPPARRLGMHKKLGGDTAGTADPNWPKGYPIPYVVVLSNKS